MYTQLRGLSLHYLLLYNWLFTYPAVLLNHCYNAVTVRVPVTESMSVRAAAAEILLPNSGSAADFKQRSILTVRCRQL